MSLGPTIQIRCTDRFTSQCFCTALAFWYGGMLLGKHEYTVFQFYVCFTEVLFGANAAGSIFSTAPDMAKAKSAAAEFKKLFDRQPTIDTWSESGESLQDGIQGLVEFRNVHFRYPTRPGQAVLKGINLTVKPGQYAALVCRLPLFTSHIQAIP